MTQDFTGKTAIVTGAGTGIGFEIARQLANSGANVVLNDINPKIARDAANIINKEGGKCIEIAGDASQVKFINTMVSQTVKEFGKVELVVANAGITTFGEFLSYQPSDFQRLIEVNLQGSFFLAQACAKQIIEQQTSGRILFMSSVTGHQAHPNLAAYGMTKAALEMLAKSLAVDLAKHGITVNAIAPGATITERTNNLDANYVETWNKLTPTGQICGTTDIANAALFLLADASRQITGQSLVIDGGWTSYSPPPKN